MHSQLLFTLILLTGSIASVSSHNSPRAPNKHAQRRHYQRQALSSGMSAPTPSSTSTSAATSASTIASSNLGHASSLGSASASGPSASGSVVPSTSVASSSSAPAATFTSPSAPSPREPTSDLQTVFDRRLPFIISSVSGLATIPKWLSSLNSSGQWPDVDYTAGCDGRRANWPAQDHWNRINTLASAYHGSSSFNANTTVYTQSAEVLTAIFRAMDYWFANDFTNIACLDSGGLDSCPCGTPGLWNGNWFSNIILIPRLVGQACLLLLEPPSTDGASLLTPSQFSNCTKITSRAFATFNYNHVNGLGTLTGANTLDVASIGVSLALMNGNAGLMAEAYAKVHAEVMVQEAVRADGIRPDGSFAQHVGVLYDGNYGKDYSNDVLALEIQAAGTAWQAGPESASRAAFSSYVDGFQWAIVRNVVTGILHWDLSSLGRFISFPVADNQATGSIKINLTQVDVLGQQWNESEMSAIVHRLQQNTTSANAGQLVGNRYFWDTDYMVHRGKDYVTTVKMYSQRTTNTECVNSQNLFGFHLSDGTVYNYQTGSEYEDIAAAWDWNLIPGTSLDYGGTPLGCDTTTQQGLEAFVGGLSDGQIGMSAMRYTNPVTKAARWQKAWFFFEEDVQHVLVSAFVGGAAGAPIVHVLDQKRLAADGTVYVDGKRVGNATSTTPLAGASASGRTLWHDRVGYVFDGESGDGNALVVQTGPKSGAWSAIGTSTKPNITNLPLFAAYVSQDALQFDKRVAYSVYPVITHDAFQRRVGSSPRLRTVQNDASVSAVLDLKWGDVGIVFWATGGGAVRLDGLESIRGKQRGWANGGDVIVRADRGVLLMIRGEKGTLVVSDPTQLLQYVTVTFEGGGGWKRSIHVAFPTGQGGKSVSRKLW